MPMTKTEKRFSALHRHYAELRAEERVDARKQAEQRLVNLPQGDPSEFKVLVAAYEKRKAERVERKKEQIRSLQRAILASGADADLGRYLREAGYEGLVGEK